MNGKEEPIMYNGTKETLCTACGHREICSKKNEFLAVQKAIDDLSIGTEENGVARVCDMQWMNIILQCSHRISNVTTKGGI